MSENARYWLEQHNKLAKLVEEYAGRAIAAGAEVERLRDAHEQIVQWSEAYPLNIFPEPDFKKAHKVLTAAGITLDAISASNMRHVIDGVGRISRAALAEPVKEG